MSDTTRYHDPPLSCCQLKRSKVSLNACTCWHTFYLRTCAFYSTADVSESHIEWDDLLTGSMESVRVLRDRSWSPGSQFRGT